MFKEGLKEVTKERFLPRGTIFLLAFLLFLNFVSSIGVNIPQPPIVTGGNYSINVNNTDHLQGYTVASLWSYYSGLGNALWCQLTGCTMTGDISFTNKGLTNTEYISFDLTNTQTPAEGKLYWNDNDGTLNIGMKGGNVNLQVGQEMLLRVKNDQGSQINNGEVVYVSNATGNNILVKLADADLITSHQTIGIATENIGTGQHGYITLVGMVRDINTTGFTEGSPIYLSQTAGKYTQTIPLAPAHTVKLGYITRTSSTVGELYASIQIGQDLSNLDDVLIVNPSNGQVLVYNSTSGLWQNKNVSSIVNLSGYVPYTGATQDVDLGNYNLKAKEVWTTAIKDTGTEAIVFDVQNGIFYSDDLQPLWDFSQGIYSKSSFSPDTYFLGYNTQTNQLQDSVGHPAMDLELFRMLDASGDPTTYSIDWYTRHLASPDQTNVLDWSVDGLVNITGKAKANRFEQFQQLTGSFTEENTYINRWITEANQDVSGTHRTFENILGLILTENGYDESAGTGQAVSIVENSNTYGGSGTVYMNNLVNRFSVTDAKGSYYLNGALSLNQWLTPDTSYTFPDYYFNDPVITNGGTISMTAQVNQFEQPITVAGGDLTYIFTGIDNAIGAYFNDEGANSISGTIYGSKSNLFNFGGGVADAYGFWSNLQQSINGEAWNFYVNGIGNNYLGGDNQKTYFGSNKEASVYFDGTDFVIDYSTIIGDYANGNYSKFEADGTYVMNGAATVWNDVVVPIQTAQQGTHAMDWDVNEKTYYMGDPVSAITEDCFDFAIQTPHWQKNNTNVELHLHGYQISTSTNNYTLRLNYTYYGINQANTTWISSTKNYTPSSISHNNTIFMLASIPSTNKGISATLKGEVCRVNGDASTQNLYIDFLDAHFEQNIIGSRQEYIQ